MKCFIKGIVKIVVLCILYIIWIIPGFIFAPFLIIMIIGGSEKAGDEYSIIRKWMYSIKSINKLYKW